jgi:hypothetical protein
MKTLTLISLLCLFAQATIHSQSVRKADVRGILVDETEAPLSGATVMLLAAKDSVLVSFAATDGTGKFLLKNVNAGNYLLKLSYVGFRTQTETLEIGEAAEVVLGSMTLSAAAEVLSEVEIKADHVPIQIKKDTIEYNADAFQTQPNGVVEDLL